ncbi:MAG TPA: hypothetical protein VL069_03705 [Opitutus sp.]|nr:hypothetical protein [Opitutus sp.]
MKAIKCLFALATLAVVTVTQLQGQQPAAPEYYQTLHYIKVPQASRTEFEKMIKDVSIKIAETRVNAGEMISWTMLRAVMPAGSEARADFLISTIYQGPPPAPLDHSANVALFKKAGLTMSFDEFLAIRNRTSSLVAAELWRPLSRVGTPQKGHYIVINQMKAKDPEAYVNFEQTTWRPIAEQIVKDGGMSGWIFASKQFPSGSETPYTFYTADMYPTWAAIFQPWAGESAFAKAHPGKSFEETFAKLDELRSLAVRELWVVTERVAK